LAVPFRRGRWILLVDPPFVNWDTISIYDNGVCLPEILQGVLVACQEHVGSELVQVIEGNDHGVRIVFFRGVMLPLENLFNFSHPGTQHVSLTLQTLMLLLQLVLEALILIPDLGLPKQSFSGLVDATLEIVVGHGGGGPEFPKLFDPSAEMLFQFLFHSTALDEPGNQATPSRAWYGGGGGQKFHITLDDGFQSR